MPPVSVTTPPEEAKWLSKEDTPPKFRPFSRWDVLVLLGSALYLVLVLRHPWFSDDAGYIALGAERIARGQVPYRDFFSELGPGTHYLQAAVFKLFGVGLPAVNLVVWLIGLGISWLTYRIGKLLIDGPLAVLPSCFFIAVCYPTNYALSHHWTGTLFFLLTLLCMAESVSGGSWHRRGEGFLWLVAGILSGATLLCMQSKGVMAFLLGPAYLVIAERVFVRGPWPETVRRVWEKSLWFLAGAGGFLAAVAVFFVWKHASGDWLYDNFVFPLTNYWPYQNPPGTFWIGMTHPLVRLLAQPSQASILLLLGYYFFMPVGPAVVLAGGIWCVRSFRDSENVRARLILLVVLGSFAALLSELHSLDVKHFVMGGVLLAPILLTIYQSFLRRNPGARRMLVAGGAAVAAFVIWGSAWQAAFVAQRNTPVATRRGALYVVPEDAGWLTRRIDFIQRRVPAGGDTFFLMYDASLYFLTATNNPTRFDTILPVFHTPSQMSEVANTLLLRRPRFIFDLSREEAPTAPVVVIPHPLEIFLSSPESPYRLEQEVEGLALWTLKK